MQFPPLALPPEPYSKTFLNNIIQYFESKDSESEEDSFERASSSFSVFIGQVNNIPARILINDGPELNEIYEGFCQSNHMAIEGTSHTATMAKKKL